MRLNCSFPVLAACLALAVAAFAGVSRAIQEQYKREYDNKAMFLKIPVYSERQMVYVTAAGIRAEQGTGSPRYKVGDQLRVTAVEFSNDEIRFRMSGITAPGVVELAFRFDAGLQEGFPNRDVFDRAIQSTLTEGIKYKDIEDAKDNYVVDQFERSVREIAASASVSSESVLRSIAPHVPAYQDAEREAENLRGKLQEVSGQLSQAQAENRKAEAELKSAQADLSRLKSANASLQEKIDSTAAQVTRLGDELRDAKGTAQGYQKELANIQRSLNLKVDSSRDLAGQITELGQALRKLQRENETLAGETNALRTSLQAQQAANGKLLGDNEDLKSKNHQMQMTIQALTSSGDSLAKKYLDLKTAKEKLDDFSEAAGTLRTRVVEEGTDSGVYRGRANLFLKDVLLGSLDWSIPVRVGHGESATAEAGFSGESIDSVRLTPQERHLLRSFGSKLKLRIDMDCDPSEMELAPEDGEHVREIGERERTAWRWRMTSHTTEDCRVQLTASLLNRNSDAITLLEREPAVDCTNPIRQLRSRLQPVPLAVGAVLGFLLFGIIGIFRRSAKAREPAAPARAQKKQL